MNTETPFLTYRGWVLVVFWRRTLFQDLNYKEGTLSRALYSKTTSDYTPKGSKKKIYYRLVKKQPPSSIGLTQTQTHKLKGGCHEH